MDHVNGSWFHQLDRANQPIGTVWPDKSDLYYATQSMMFRCATGCSQPMRHLRAMRRMSRRLMREPLLQLVGREQHD